MSLPSQPPRFQYSLRWLLIAITVAAVVLGMWPIFGTPITWLVALAVMVVWPTPLLLMAIFARREPQAFAIGALVPCLEALRGGVMFNWPVTSGSPVFWNAFMLFVILLTSVVCGAIGIATRRWITRKGWDRTE